MKRSQESAIQLASSIPILLTHLLSPLETLTQ